MAGDSTVDGLLTAPTIESLPDELLRIVARFCGSDGPNNVLIAAAAAASPRICRAAATDDLLWQREGSSRTDTPLLTLVDDPGPGALPLLRARLAAGGAVHLRLAGPRPFAAALRNDIRDALGQLRCCRWSGGGGGVVSLVARGAALDAALLQSLAAAPCLGATLTMLDLASGTAALAPPLSRFHCSGGGSDGAVEGAVCGSGRPSCSLDVALPAFAALASLDLSRAGCGVVTDVTLCTVARALPQLRALSVADCMGVTDVGARALAAGPPLERLDISGCASISSCGMDQLFFPRSPLAAESQGGAGARVVCFPASLVHLSVARTQIADTALTHFAAAASRRLRALDLGDCSKLTPQGVAALARCVPHLTRLCLAGVPGVTDAAFELLLGSGGLGESGTTTTTMTTATSSSCALRELVLDCCWRLGAPGLELVGARASLLERLSLVDVAAVNDEALRRLLEALPALKSIDVSLAPRVSDAALQAISAQPPAALRELLVTDPATGVRRNALLSRH